MQDASKEPESSDMSSLIQAAEAPRRKAEAQQGNHKRALRQVKQADISKANNARTRKATPMKGRTRPESATEKENVAPALHKPLPKPTKTKSKAADQSQSRSKPPYQLSQPARDRPNAQEVSLIDSVAPKKQKETTAEEDRIAGADHEQGNPQLSQLSSL